MITAAQMRAARAMLRWSAEELAKRSGLSYPTIQRMESTEGVPQSLAKNLEMVRATLTDAGIFFIEGTDGLVGVMVQEKSLD